MIVNANGAELYVEEHGTGEPVLMLHGWPDSCALWRNQVPVLTANGFRVITPDLRKIPFSAYNIYHRHLRNSSPVPHPLRRDYSAPVLGAGGGLGQ